MSEVSVSQSGEVETTAQGIPIVHVTIPNPSVQVQSVIQSNQPSVIHTAGPNIQAIQIANIDEDLSDDPDGKKRREILARRPSYRKILNDLSSESTAIPGVAKIEEESNSSQSQDGGEGCDPATNLASGDSVRYQSSPGVIPGTIQITTHPDGSLVTQGLQTLTMTNALNSSPGSTPGAATIVQYAQGPDGQFYIPVGGTNVQAYQIATSGALPQGVVMTTAGGAITSQQQHSEEASRKRELRLLKNRDAARECRRKKKDYVKCLENRVAVLENQNKTLIEELKALKELYCQKEG